MWRRTITALLVISWMGSPSANLVVAQQDQSETKRKVVNRVMPTYPELARTMNLKGSVRVDALVTSNGTVKSVEVKGGHPVLAQAAENAIRKWKWEPATHESVEIIEVKFEPH